VSLGPSQLKSVWRSLAVRFLTDSSAKIERTRNNHLKWMLNGKTVISAWSPSDHRAVKNTESNLRKHLGWKG
jgi:hypothetical protein